MRIGCADGPGKERAHRSTHVIYDARSGRIVATHHAISAAPSSDKRIRELMQDAHETSGISLDHLAILTDPDAPHGEGEVRVDQAAKRLVRSAGPTRIRP